MKETTPPAETEQIDGVPEVTTGVSPEVAVAVGVYVAPPVNAPVGAVEVTVIAFRPLPTVSDADALLSDPSVAVNV